MRVYILVFAAALPAFSYADTVIQVPSDLTHNSSNVLNGHLSRLLPLDNDDAPAGSLPALQRRWHPDDPIPEPADNDIWRDYVHKGRRLMASMSYSDFDLAQMDWKPHTTMQSPYGYESLKQWGYTMHERVSSKYRDFRKLGIARSLRRMGISDKCREEGGTWNAASITHGDPDGDVWIEDQRYKGPDGRRRRMTGARFHMAVTPEGGIMTQYRESPWVSFKQTHPEMRSEQRAAGLPHMQRSSDIMWAMWERFVPREYNTKIKFFISTSIENPTTLTLIRRALDSKGKELTTDGIKFNTDSREGSALLASPIGAGFAHFLIERKLQVGLKTIGSVRVMQCTDEDESPCMVFEVKNLHAPTRPPEDR